MTILEMIKEWRKGCSCGLHNPADCPDCTTALIDAIERSLIKENTPLNPLGGEGAAGTDASCFLDCIAGESGKIGLEEMRRNK